MSDCNHTAAESCLRGDECAQCLRDAASSFVPAPGSTHLALAQKCFTEWLQELDGLLHDSELAYDEYAGNILSGDMEGWFGRTCVICRKRRCPIMELIYVGGGTFAHVRCFKKELSADLTNHEEAPPAMRSLEHTSPSNTALNGVKGNL